MMYKQHIFLDDGTFTIARTPLSGYLDVLLVGGGAAGRLYAWFLNGEYLLGGAGGQVIYKRVYVSAPRTYKITVGKGGQQKVESSSGGSTYLVSSGGSPSSMSDVATASGGALSTGITVPFTNQEIDGSPGILITDGLFADNTNYYGGSGGNIGGSGNNAGGKGGVGGGGDASFIFFTNSASQHAGKSGTANTGGGGGASRGAGSYTPTASQGTGGSGIVIIRYPIIV